MPVILYFGENLSNGQTIEVLGEVKVDQGGKVMIEGAGVHSVGSGPNRKVRYNLIPVII